MRLCVIPARGGSKRIPRKNIKPFFGQPMLAYPIKAALESGLFDQVIVSTDDDEIAQVAKKFGAAVPFQRPAELSNDHAATAPVIIHAIEWFEQQDECVDEVAILYPCTPFISLSLLHTSYQHWKQSGAPHCVSVGCFPSAPQRALTTNSQGRIESLLPQYQTVRTQDLAPAYYDAGQFYWITPALYKQGKRAHSDAAVPFILPRHLAHDIDTPEDWYMAELFYDLLAKARTDDNNVG